MQKQRLRHGQVETVLYLANLFLQTQTKLARRGACPQTP